MKLFISKLHYKNTLDFFEAVALRVLLFFSVFYGLVVSVRNFLYDKKIIKQYKSKAYTISVGNLTTGGVGKTPVTAAIANYFSSTKNKKVAILSRGYGASLNNKKPNLISNGDEVFYDSDLAGDEPVWLAQNCSKTAVITCASRVEAAKLAVDSLKAELIILDDGFQHRKMKRDLNIVLIDNKNKFGNGNVLPAGPLREPLYNIDRADKIVLVNKSYDDEDANCYCNALEKLFNKKVYLCKMIPEYVYNIITNEHLKQDEEIIAFCAIGQPKEFYNFLKNDYNLVVTIDFEDHHSYDESNLRELIEIANKEGVKNIVTTEKDAVKIKDLLLKYKPDLNVYALKLKAYFDVEEICND